MAGKATPPKPQPAGWGDEAKLPIAQNPVLPLTSYEIVGLREVLKRHGFDSEKGTF
jgi:hypothetical protein